MVAGRLIEAQPVDTVHEAFASAAVSTAVDPASALGAEACDGEEDAGTRKILVSLGWYLVL